MHTDDIPVPQQVWEDTTSSSRSVSEGSLNASSEQLALSGFAYQLTSIIGSDDGSIADEVDVKEEAKLLMSLSCSTPSTITTNITTNNHHHKTNATATTSSTNYTGRITPPSSDSSSCYSSTSSKRDSFCFTCPSLSLENHSRDALETSIEQLQQHSQQQQPQPQEVSSSTSSTSQSSSLPSVLLGRSLKIDDKDALRLSSEAMGRNILQSYKKALDWRLKSWEHSLSCVLVHKERDLLNANATEEAMKGLLKSGEANLLLALKAMETKLRVMDATTSFKVLPQRLNTSTSEQQPPSKKQRIEERLGSGLEETEYEYQVAHAMMLEGCLNIHTPAGYCKIELEVPGSMTGTFLTPASSDDSEELTSVRIDVNTDILAAMIEKSSRTVIRAAAEALLKGDVDVEEAKEEASEEQTVQTKPKGHESKTNKEVEATTTSPQPVTATSTPKRKLSEERMQRMVVITPARNAASSPSTIGDSDHEDKPVLLSLPDSFGGESKPKLKMLTPKPSRKKRKSGLPTVVTPHKTQSRETITSGVGPTLPLLVEVACAMVKK